MRFSKKIVSVAAAAALVAGASLASASPAAAYKKATIKGDTNILVPTALITAAQGAGVTITPIQPARALATMEIVDVQFPVAGPVADGAIFHRGGLSFASANTDVTLTFNKPIVEWGSGPGIKAGAIIKGTLGGLEAVNGLEVTLFDVKNIKASNKKGKVTRDGKKNFKRTDTTVVSGDVTLVNNATLVGQLNTILGVDIFTPGLPFGTTVIETKTTVFCKTKKTCR
jgi:hypothetical protein